MIKTEELNLFAGNSAATNKSLVGVVKHILFEAQDTFYKVLVVKVLEHDFEWAKNQITVVGNFSDIKEGGRYRFFGRLVAHPTYGEQFRVDNYQLEVATTTEGLIAYFASENFPGIGKKTAAKIVTKLGTDAISKILASKSVLTDLALSAKQRQTIVEVLQANNGMEQIIVGLNSFGFSGNLANKVYNAYHEQALDIIHENPYRLARDINGISFSRADQIAEELGFASNDPNRIEAAIFQVLYKANDQEGHTYLTLRQVVSKAQDYLEAGRNEEIDSNEIADMMIKLAEQRKIVPEGKLVYLKRNYYAELKIAENCYRLVKDGDQPEFSAAKLAHALRIVEKKLGIDYDHDQLEAIKAAIVAPVFLLTGGPGTGKTTIIKGIIEAYCLLYDLNPQAIKLAAPTGRAAKRMSEVTGLTASTIHRLLGLNGNEEDEFEPKEVTGNLLIVDESSMVDTHLMETLLEAIPSGMQVILVGDRNQLPSVGAGQVFSDLLASNVLPKKELSKIYRQGEGSTIVTLAHKIQEGKLPADLLVKQADRSFINCQPNQVPQVIEQVVKIALAKGIKQDEIQLLAPMYKGIAGVDALNELIQGIFNPRKANKKEVTYLNQQFRIGDRVLHLVNNPEENIFNGDIGKIVGIEDAKKEQQLIVAFDSNEVTFDPKNWNNLRLAYCLSIHKSQGSEFPVVILPLVRQFSRMLTRNLLYTAITRAKQKLIMVGDPSAFKLSVETLSLNRQTSLKQRLTEVFETDQSSKEDADTVQVAAEQTTEEQVTQERILTMALIEGNQIEPLIGLDGLSPYDFMEKVN